MTYIVAQKHSLEQLPGELWVQKLWPKVSVASYDLLFLDMLSRLVAPPPESNMLGGTVAESKTFTACFVGLLFTQKKWTTEVDQP